MFGLNHLLAPIVLPWLSHPAVVTLATWSVIMLELILGALLLAPYARRRHWLAVALVFHAGIVLVHGLSSFFCAMAAGVLLYLRPYAEPIRWLTGFRWRANSWVRRLAEPVKG